MSMMYRTCFWLAVLLGAISLPGQAAAWVKHFQPFGNGEATVVFHLFCQRQNCQPQPWWPDMIQHAMDQWNNAGANFVFSTRRVRSTDDPCNLPGEVAVIPTEDGRLCPGDRPLLGGPNTVTGRTVYKPTLQSARIYIKAPDSLLYDLIPSEARFLLEPFLVHEFGHVVGLGHPDEDGQRVSSIMNSRVAFDGHTLRADDIAGIHALYGDRGPLVGFLENPAPDSLPKRHRRDFWLGLRGRDGRNYDLV